MQIKKEDLKIMILEVAKQEFIKKGYENSSMRVIAKKANTTLGNVYTYFSSKEAILEEILNPIIEDLKCLEKEHFEDREEMESIEDIGAIMLEIENTLYSSEMRYLLHKELIILLDLKTTKFVAIREEFIDKCKRHIAWHLRFPEENNLFAATIVNMFIDCLRHVILEDKDPKLVKEEFVRVFQMVCAGIGVIHEGKEGC